MLISRHFYENKHKTFQYNTIEYYLFFSKAKFLFLGVPLLHRFGYFKVGSGYPLQVLPAVRAFRSYPLRATAVPG